MTAQPGARHRREINAVSIQQFTMIGVQSDCHNVRVGETALVGCIFNDHSEVESENTSHNKMTLF